MLSPTDAILADRQVYVTRAHALRSAAFAEVFRGLADWLAAAAPARWIATAAR